VGGFDESLLMLREQDIDNQKSLHCLAETFCLSEIRSTYGFLRSAGKNRAILQKAARRLRSRIALIKDKEYCLDATAEFSMPLIPCYEQKKTITVSVENREVTVPKVDPTYQNSSTFSRYYCDLVSEHKTIRYPFDLTLPQDSDIFLLLNLPGKFYSFQNVVGFGTGYLSITFTGNEETAVKFQLPSEHEIFQVILDRTGCILKKDEKNIRYSKTLDLFPDFNTACIALKGKCWDIIKTLEYEPLTYDKLLGKAKLGKSKTSEQFPENAKYILEQYRGVFQEISKNRVGDTLKHLLRKESTTENILDYLNQIKVIRRKWLLNKCQSCDQEYWMDTIDITSPVMCPGCGNQIVITDRVRVGYELNQLVRLAVFKEGMRPVIL
jgi:DNA-directed RNA polymerase subunit RPC12/RpoP